MDCLSLRYLRKSSYKSKAIEKQMTNETGVMADAEAIDEIAGIIESTAIRMKYMFVNF